MYRVEVFVQGLWDLGLEYLFWTGLTLIKEDSFVEVNAEVEE